jgi:uncharacterized membrane protein YdjX (TVP38/TMEM64 family)
MTLPSTLRRHIWRWAAAAVLALLLVALAIAGFKPPLVAWIASFRDWIDGLGVWGVAIFVAAYVAATLAMLPCAPLSIVAGLAWGPWALPLVIAAVAVGASLAFHIARRLAQARVQAWARRNPRGEAVVEAVTEQGWKVVLLLRLSPLVPFNLQNYLFGITRIRFTPYLVATLIGVLPGALLFISVGAFGHGAEDADSRLFNWILFAVGLAATIAAAVLVTRRVLARLRDVERPGGR